MFTLSSGMDRNACFMSTLLIPIIGRRGCVCVLLYQLECVGSPRIGVRHEPCHFGYRRRRSRTCRHKQGRNGHETTTDPCGEVDAQKNAEHEYDESNGGQHGSSTGSCRHCFPFSIHPHPISTMLVVEKQLAFRNWGGWCRIQMIMMMNGG